MKTLVFQTYNKLKCISVLVQRNQTRGGQRVHWQSRESQRVHWQSPGGQKVHWQSPECQRVHWQSRLKVKEYTDSRLKVKEYTVSLAWRSKSTLTVDSFTRYVEACVHIVAYLQNETRIISHEWSDKQPTNSNINVYNLLFVVWCIIPLYTKVTNKKWYFYVTVLQT